MLRAKGIIPPKKEAEITEDQIVSILEQTIEEKQGISTLNYVYQIFALLSSLQKNWKIYLWMNWMN